MANEPTPSSEQPASRLTVLLGDDRDAAEPWHRTTVGLLGSQGVRTVVAHGGRHAMALIEGGLTGGGPRIDVAVLEQRMPDMTALQLLRRLQPPAQTPQVGVPPAILLADPDDRGGTGGVSGHLLSDALTVRVFSVLPRPVDTNLLLDTLARALRRYHAGRWPGRKAEG